MTGQASTTLSVMHRFALPAERVFDAWLDPECAGTWLFATPSGRMVRVAIDPRIGGRFLLVDRRDGEDIAHTGQYLEIDRPRRLVFTFAVPKFSALATLVTIDIARDGEGCRLTLTHEGVLPDYTQRTEEGWGRILEGLARALAAAP